MYTFGDLFFGLCTCIFVYYAIRWLLFEPSVPNHAPIECDTINRNSIWFKERSMKVFAEESFFLSSTLNLHLFFNVTPLLVLWAAFLSVYVVSSILLIFLLVPPCPFVVLFVLSLAVFMFASASSSHRFPLVIVFLATLS